jgi:hypothetical protein
MGAIGRIDGVGEKVQAERPMLPLARQCPLNQFQLFGDPRLADPRVDSPVPIQGGSSLPARLPDPGPTVLRHSRSVPIPTSATPVPTVVTGTGTTPAARGGRDRE